MGRFRLVWLEVTVSFYGWWLAPQRPVSAEARVDSVRHLAVIVLAGEALTATFIWTFLRAHGQV